MDQARQLFFNDDHETVTVGQDVTLTPRQNNGRPDIADGDVAASGTDTYLTTNQTNQDRLSALSADLSSGLYRLQALSVVVSCWTTPPWATGLQALQHMTMTWPPACGFASVAMQRKRAACNSTYNTTLGMSTRDVLNRVYDA